MNSKSQVNAKKLKNKSRNTNKNRHFFQFNTQITPQILYKLAEHPLAIKVFAVLIHCGGKLGVVAIKQKYIQEFLNRTRNSVSCAIRYLRKLGVISVTKIDTRNVYIMNPTLIWQESYNKRSYIHYYFNFNDPYNINNNDKSLNKVFDRLERLSHQVPYEEFTYIRNKHNKSEK